MSENDSQDTKPPADQTRARARRHEIWNALHQIIGYCELVQEDAIDQDQRSFLPDLEKIVLAAHRLGELIDEVLEEAPVPASPLHMATPATAKSWQLPVVGDQETRVGSSTADELLLLIRKGMGIEPSEGSAGVAQAGKASVSIEAVPVPPPQLARRTSVIPPLEEENRGSVLVVDDNPTNRALLARHLFRQGFSVCTAQGGHEALETLASHPFDLVLLDVVMPDLNGYDTLKRIRKNSSVADLPVIMVTGRTANDDVVRALEMGANDYVTKPLDISLILARIKTQLALKKALDFFHEVSIRFEGTEQLSEFITSVPTRLDEVYTWSRTRVEALAKALGVPEVGLWALDRQHQLRVLVRREVKPPSSDELDEVARLGEPYRREEDFVLPVVGFSGELVAALVIPRKYGELSQMELQLISLCARQLGGALEVRSVHEQLVAARKTAVQTPEEDARPEFDLLQTCPECGRCFDQTVHRCSHDGNALDGSRPFPYHIDERFRLIRILGEGGMGTVFLALDTRLSREVAIKVINPSHFHNERARLRFAREARTIGHILHPNIISVFDCGDLKGGSLYIVMERLQGTDLGRLIAERGPGRPAEVATFLRQAAAGLAAAHDAGVLHRDIKPENFFLIPLGSSFYVKIVDFGLAKEINTEPTTTQTGSLETRAGTILGTPLFMAPEQAMGKVSEFRSDLYSLAAVAYYALTGKLISESSLFVQILLDVLESIPPLVSSLISVEVPPEVDRAFMIALDKNPEARPARVDDWVASFVDFLEKMPDNGPGWIRSDRVLATYELG